MDGDSLTYSLTQPVAWQSTTGEFTWTPDESQDGMEVRFTVSDGTATVVQTAPAFTVVEVNVPPELQVVNNHTLTVGNELRFRASATDTDRVTGRPQALRFSLHGAPVDAQIDPITGIFQWTPPTIARPRHRFTITVTDTAGGSDSEPITISLNGTAPVAELQAYDDYVVVQEDGAIAIAVLINDTHSDSPATLALVPSALPQHGFASVSTTADVISYRPEHNFTGTDQFKYTVTQGAESSQATVTVRTTPVNDPPIWAGALPTLTFLEHDEVKWQPPSIRVSDVYHCLGRACNEEVEWRPPSSGIYDPDGDTIANGDFTFALAPDGDIDSPGTLHNPPLDMSIDPGNGALQWTPGENDDGVYRFAILLTDRDGGIAQRRLQLHIREQNVPPTLTPVPEQSVTVGTPLRFTLVAADPDRVANQLQTLSYSMHGLPATASLDAHSGVLTYTPTAAEAGTYHVTFTVTDAAGATDTTATTVMVRGATTAQNLVGVVAIRGAGPAVDTPLTAAVRDPNGGVAEVTWRWHSTADQEPYNWTEIATATEASYTPVAGDANRRLRAVAQYRDSLTTNADQTAYSVATVPVAATAVMPPAPVVDQTGPAITGVHITSPTPPNQVHYAGELIEVSVVFDEPVVLTGTGDPTLSVVLGTTTRIATLARGAGTPVLVFAYKVGNSDRAKFGPAIPANALALVTTTTLRDHANNDADLTHAAVPVNGNHRIDGVDDQPTSVTLRAGEFDPVADAVTLDISFSREVTGFDATDVTTSTGTIAVRPGATDGTYVATLANPADGHPEITIPAGAARDWLGLPTVAATPVTVRVDRPGHLILATPSPGTVRVADAVRATVVDPSGMVVNQRWQWQRAVQPISAEASPIWADIPQATARTYAVRADDLNHVLRVTVMYDDRFTTGLTLSSVTTPPVTNEYSVSAVAARIMDINSNDDVDVVDALIMYYTLAFPDLLGTAHHPRFAGVRRALLHPLLPPFIRRDEAQLQNLIRAAEAGRANLVWDINDDAQVTPEDALILYYVLTQNGLVNDGTVGDLGNFRRLFLSSLTVDPAAVPDASIRHWLQRAAGRDAAL